MNINYLGKHNQYNRNRDTLHIKSSRPALKGKTDTPFYIIWLNWFISSICLLLIFIVSHGNQEESGNLLSQIGAQKHSQFRPR